MATWVIPCNRKYFDIEKYLKNSNEVVWQTSCNMVVNETVYIYVSGGLSEIKYKGYIKNVDLPDDIVQENKYAIRYMQKFKKYILIEIEKEYPNGSFLLKELKIHGLKQFQRQSRATDELIN